MNKKITIWIAIIILLLIVVFFVQKNNNKPAVVTTPPTTAMNTVTYSCDNNKSILAEFYSGTANQTPQPGQPPMPTGTVHLTLPDGSMMTLNQTISADGGKYQNADGSFVFWSKGNGAMVLQNNEQKDYTGCIVIAPNPTNQDLPQTYSNSKYGFSIRLPQGYTTDASYVYNMTPTKTFNGVKFTIPASLATGTNLGSDTYISVETNPSSQTCTADTFLDGSNIVAKTMTENGTDYSVASSTGAGAGNRYEETVYSIPGTNPCIAVRYFIHYSVIENYPPGTVTAFDEQSLINQFDTIRKTLTLN